MLSYKFCCCVWRIVIENHFKFKCLFRQIASECQTKKLSRDLETLIGICCANNIVSRAYITRNERILSLLRDVERKNSFWIEWIRKKVGIQDYFMKNTEASFATDKMGIAFGSIDIVINYLNCRIIDNSMNVQNDEGWKRFIWKQWWFSIDLKLILDCLMILFMIYMYTYVWQINVYEIL